MLKKRTRKETRKQNQNPLLLLPEKGDKPNRATSSLYQSLIASLFGTEVCRLLLYEWNLGFLIYAVLHYHECKIGLMNRSLKGEKTYRVSLCSRHVEGY